MFKWGNKGAARSHFKLIQNYERRVSILGS